MSEDPGFLRLDAFTITGTEQRNIKQLDLFGLQFIRVRAGVITSKNVEGFNVGLTAR